MHFLTLAVSKIYFISNSSRLIMPILSFQSATNFTLFATEAAFVY